MSGTKKALVLSLTRMGDIIQSIPFFRRLRLKHKDWEIHVLVEDCFKEVAEFLPGVDHIHTVKLEDLLPVLSSDSAGNLADGLGFYRNFVETLRTEAFDEVWNLTHTRPATVLNYLLAGDRGKGVTLDANGYQQVNAPWLRYFFATNLARPWCQFNLVDIYANCVDGVAEGEGRSIAISTDMIQPYEFLAPEQTDARIIVALHMGASQKAKQWPTESFRRLANLLLKTEGLRIVLVGSPRDKELGTLFEDLPRVDNYIGKTTPGELAGLLSKCNLLITNDSGPMHVAAAVGTRVIAITVGSALGCETAPYGDGHVVIEPEAGCFPCAPNNPCPQSTCALSITPEIVAEVTGWMTEGETSIPSASDLQTCRIYQTAFSPRDGMLTLNRIFTAKRFARDELSEMVRPAWLMVLNRSDLPPDGTTKINSGAVREQASQAQRITEVLKNCTENLMQTATRYPASTSVIMEMGRRIGELDKALFQVLTRHGLLSSFSAFVNISKASLGGETLLEQTKETYEIYGQLSLLLNALTLEKSFDELSNKLENKNKNEVGYENYSQWM